MKCAIMQQPVPGVVIVGAAFCSAFAPGFIIGLVIVVTGGGLNGLQATIEAPFAFSLLGAIVGAPIALLVFAPTILLLRGAFHLNWFALAAIGYLCVFSVGLLCTFNDNAAPDASGPARFAVFGAIAGFCFWLLVGDVESTGK